MPSQPSYDSAVSTQAASSTTLCPEDARWDIYGPNPGGRNGVEQPKAVEPTIDLPALSSKVSSGGDLSRQEYEGFIRLQATFHHSASPPSEDRVNTNIFSAILKNGHADWLVHILMTLPGSGVTNVYASFPVVEWEQRLWERRAINFDLILTSQEKSRSLLYRLIEATSDAGNPLDQRLLNTLFRPYIVYGSFPMLFPIERSHFGIPEGSNSVSSSFRDTIDNFIIRLEDAYKDRPYELRKHNAELRSHWILEATGTFFARSADLFTDYTVDCILQRIGVQWRSPSVHASRRSADLVAAPPTGSLDGAGPGTSMCGELLDAAAGAARHPASPLLLLSIYLATHSRRVSEAMVAKGPLATLQRLFDEPPAAVVGPRGGRRTPAVSGASRNVMHELSHELLVRVSRHVDLRDCTIKQELRDEIVAASRAVSTRAFGVQWWETVDEDVYAFRIRRDMAGAENSGGRGGLEHSTSRGRTL